MAAPTVEAPQERTLPSAGPQSVLFMSRRSELALVLEPMRNVHNAAGEKVLTTDGQHVKFRDGVLRIPLSGTMRGMSGEQLDAKEVLAALEKHTLAGDQNDGFWRVDEPAPAPSREELDTLAALAQGLDVDGLKEFLAREHAGYARPELVHQAEGMLARAQQLRGEQEQALEKARAEGEAAAKAAPTPPPRKGAA